MKKSRYLALGLCILLITVVSCANKPLRPQRENNKDGGRFINMLNQPPQSMEDLKKHYTNKYQNQTAKEWGERVSGVVTRINTTDKVIALTFDACGGGPRGDGYDSELINFLIREKVPATLFINARWMDVNANTFISLANNPLFEIENHGYLHRPLSIDGKSAYGIQGTENIGEVVEEIVVNEEKIRKSTGKKPKYFRSGTAYYDEIGVRIANDLGEKVINFDVLGDAGGSFNAEQVKNACLSATSGSIVLLHMNRPESGTARGVIEAIPELRRRGFRFIKLEEYDRNLGTGPVGDTAHFFYTVVSGDSLWGISNRFGVSVRDITTLNNLEGTTIFIGQKLKIPGKSPTAEVQPSEANHLLYTVVSGDVLWKISSRFSVSVQAIQDFNRLNSSVILVGQKLKIPLTSTTKLVPPVEVIHFIRSGDTIWKLSNQYGVSIREILNRNGLTENSVLLIGQKIIIPIR